VALEQRPRPMRPEAAASEDAEALEVPALPQGGLALAGRTLLVLAGAYLVRALTDAGTLPAFTGVALGLAYAGFWQLRAGREALGGRRASAALHALASSVIAFPLVWETTARFGLLGPRGAGLAVVALSALGLAVAWRSHLTADAWLTTLAACATVLALLASTHDPVTALLTLLPIAAALEWLAFRDAWLGLRWCVAASADTVAILLVAVTLRPHPPESYPALTASGAAGALLALPALYITGIAARTLLRGQPVRLFEAVQGTLAVLVGLGGARRVLAAHELPGALPALLAVGLGGLCYAVAFAHAERRPGQGRNFYFYSTAGGLLSLGGTLELGLGSALPLVWAGLGLAAVALGRRFERTTLCVHGALYLTAGAAGSGLLQAGGLALAGPTAAACAWAAWAVAGGAAVAWAVLAGDQRRPESVAARLPRLLVAFLVVLALAGAARWALEATLGDELRSDAGAAAVARSAVLAALVVGLAWLARRGQPELAWLVYPLVALGGLKLLMQDLRAGRPATLVLSLGLYGAVLILVPRLLKSREPAG
jgi:hypothetical protein